MNTSASLHALLLYLLIGLFFVAAGVSDGHAQNDASATVGTLILQSPVQAVASINETGAYLVVPGQNLSWNRISPGTYRVLISAGSQQWQQTVQIKAGETATLVAVLASLGPPLSASAHTLAPSTAMPAPTTVVQQQKEEQARERPDDAKQRLEEQERAQREARENDRRRQEAEARAQREADQKEAAQKNKANHGKRPKRPKIL